MKIERSKIRNTDRRLSKIHYYEQEDDTRYTFYWSNGDFALYNTLCVMGAMYPQQGLGIVGKFSKVKECLEKLGAERIGHHYEANDPHYSKPFITLKESKG
jgi:hypothetical protein